jgi:NAD(P)-dependent dehydrogenase (short-subunit alcohol dehydrogenase family)
MTHKHYLVTGATSGIGFAVAQHLVKQGHKLVITGQDPQRLKAAAQQLGNNVMPIRCDNSQPEQINALAETLAAQGLMLDGIVLNAGIFEPRMFDALDAENYERTMDINFRGPLFCIQALLKQLSKPASIVFISSIAVTKAFSSAAVYSASKAAFEAAARVLNLELAEQGIRINSIRPGVTATNIQAKAGMTQGDIDAFFSSLASTPLGRVLQPADMVAAIDFLLADSSLGLRNAVIDIDGGISL